MLTELEAIRAENSKVKNDLKSRESDIRMYHSKYHEYRAENQVLREQFKNFEQQQNLKIENTPDQSAGSSNGPLEPERPSVPLYQEPRLVEGNSDSDKNGNRVSQFDQYQTGDSTKLPNRVPKKSVRSVFKFTLYMVMELFLIIDICKELCLASLNLKTLLRMIVNGFKCTKCKPEGSVRFQTLAEYHGHMIGTHKLRNVCHFCPFTTNSAHSLKKHRHIHTKHLSINGSMIADKYQCDICPSEPGTWLGTTGSLSQHRSRYH